MTFVLILLALVILGVYCNEEEQRKCGKAPEWFDLRMLDATPEQMREYWKEEAEKNVRKACEKYNLDPMTGEPK